MSKEQTREHLRKEIYATIRNNLDWPCGSFSRHEVVEILASILSDQLEVVRLDARKQPHH